MRYKEFLSDYQYRSAASLQSLVLWLYSLHLPVPNDFKLFRHRSQIRIFVTEYGIQANNITE